MIYLLCTGRDCDCVDFGRVSKHETQEDADKYIDEAYEWADGPMRFREITKEQYENHDSKAYHRDHIMEAYENGNGNKIIIP